MYQSKVGPGSLQCARCKQGFNRLNHSVYKSGKDYTRLMVCEPCWSRARTLKVPKREEQV